MHSKKGFSAWLRRPGTIVCLLLYLAAALVLIPVLECCCLVGDASVEEMLAFLERGKAGNEVVLDGEGISGRINDLAPCEDGGLVVTGIDPYIVLPEADGRVYTVTVHTTRLEFTTEYRFGELYYSDDGTGLDQERRLEAEWDVEGTYTFILPRNEGMTLMRFDLGKPGDRLWIDSVVINERGIADAPVRLWVIAAAAALFLLLSFIHYCVCAGKKRRRLSPVAQLLIVGAVFGMVIMFLLPMAQAPDEPVHVVRSFGLSYGVAFSRPDEYYVYLPASLQQYYDNAELIEVAWSQYRKLDTDKYFKAANIPLRPEYVHIFGDKNKTSSYFFIGYIPQAIGILIGRLLRLPVYWVLMLGRLTNLAAYLEICSLALKIMPTKKQLLLVIMLTPMCIQQAASISPDAMLISVGMLLTAYVLRLCNGEGDIPMKSLAALAGMALVMASIKLPYILAGALILILPLRRMTVDIRGRHIAYGKWATEKKWPVAAAIAALAVVAAAAVWVVKNHTGWLGNSMQVLMHPRSLIINILYSLKENGEFYLESLIGRLGWVTAFLPDAFIYGVLIFLVICGLQKEDDGLPMSKLTFGTRFVMLAVFGCMLAVLLLIGITWSYDPAEPFARIREVSVQGRYFLPVLPLLLLPLKSRIDFKVMSSDAVRILYFIAAPAITAVTLITRYWI